MNLSQLQQEVNYRRRESTENFISLDEITSYLNAGLRRIQENWDWEWSKLSAGFNFVQGQNVYQISGIAGNFKSPYDMSAPGAAPYPTYQFDWLNPEDFRQVSTQGMNIAATDGNLLYVQTMFGSANLTLWYYSTCVAQTSGGYPTISMVDTTDSVLMPYRFQDIIVDYAAARCYQKEGMLDDYKVAYQEYLMGMEKMKREYPATRRTPLRRMKSIRELQNNYFTPFGKNNPLNS